MKRGKEEEPLMSLDNSAVSTGGSAAVSGEIKVSVVN